MVQVWSSPNLQNLGRAFSEAIGGQPHDRCNGRYFDMDRAASMDGVVPHPKAFPAPGDPLPRPCLPCPWQSYVPC